MKNLNLLIAMALSLAFMAGMVNADGAVFTLVLPGDGEFNQSSDQILRIKVYYMEGNEALNISLWSNFSGTWSFNGTNESEIVNESVVNFTLDDLADGSYIWAYNSSDEGGAWNYSGNYSITIDTVNPLVAYTQKTLGNDSMTCPINIEVTVTDTNPSNCTLTFKGTTSTMVGSTTCRSQKSSTVDGSFGVLAYDKSGRVSTLENRTFKACATPYNPQYAIQQPEAIGEGMDNTTKIILAIIVILVLSSMSKKKRKGKKR